MVATTMASAAIDPLSPLLYVGDMAIRFADEGVPIRAIARAVRVPPDLIRTCLEKARERGRLFELPRDDWSPKIPRDKRVPELEKLSGRHDMFHPDIMRCFNLTSRQAYILLMLLKFRHASRDMLMSIGRRSNEREPSCKVVDVQICNLRKRLAPFGLEFHTHHGIGYFMATEHRRKALQIILEFVGEPVAVVDPV